MLSLITLYSSTYIYALKLLPSDTLRIVSVPPCTMTCRASDEQPTTQLSVSAALAVCKYEQWSVPGGHVSDLWTLKINIDSVTRVQLFASRWYLHARGCPCALHRPQYLIFWWVAFETVPISFSLSDNGALSSLVLLRLTPTPPLVNRRPLPLSTLLSSRQSMV